MKVLLLSLCRDKEYLDEEIGLSYIASILSEHNFEVTMSIINWDLKDYSFITEYHPDVIGISAYRFNYERIVELSEAIKQALPDVYICLGGEFPSNFYSEILKRNQSIDYVITGEGEYPFLNLIESISNRNEIELIPGVAYRGMNRQIIHHHNTNLIMNLDVLPYPSRAILRDNGKKVAKIFFSRRGVDSNGGKLLRVRSVDNIIGEIEYIVNDLGVNRFDVLDHGFGSEAYHQLLLELTHELKKRDLKIYYFMCVSADIHQRISTELIHNLIETGLCGVFIDMDTGNETDRMLFDKSVSIGTYSDALRFLEHLGLHTSISLTNINPYSTIASLKENMNFLNKHHMISSVFLLHCLPHDKYTAIYNRLLADGLAADTTNFYEVDYTFLDSRVANLNAFMNAFFEKDGKHSQMYGKICYYIIDYLNLLSYLKRKFIDVPRVAKVVTQNEASIRETLTQIGETFLTWFQELLKLAEGEWNEEMAYKLSNIYLDFNLLNEMLHALDVKKSKLIFNMFRIDSGYVDSL